MQDPVPSNPVSEQVTAYTLGGQLPGHDAIETYKSDGVVCLRQAISGEWLGVIEEGIDLALSGASADLDVVQKKGESGRFSVSSQAWRQVEPFRRFIFESPLADIAWPFLESRSLTLYYDFLLIKEAHSNSARTPWHQDHAYYPLKGNKVINSWVALDPIPVETALRFYAGSHLPGITFRATNFENNKEHYRHVRLERPIMPDIDADPDIQILTTALAPGDMLLWNSRTFHSAPGNHLPRRRAAFSINWVGDDCTYEEVAALDTYLDPSLKTGDPITGEKFPLVRGSLDGKH